VNRFVRLADDSDEVPNLRKKQYSDFKLSQSDWFQLSLLHEVLQQSWQNMAANDKFSSVAHALHAGLKNLGKWSRKTDKTDVCFICLALDPNYKLEYARSQWDTDAFDEGKKKLEAAVSDTE
ncbi:hypothetical protein P692DRAFT_20745381, partial [Suillus brevipes Sb2]